jgi:hypothetical protein
MLSPFQIALRVAELRTGNPLAEIPPDLAAPLHALVHDLARGEVIDGGGNRFRLPESDADDVAQSVLTTWLSVPEKLRDAVLGHPEIARALRAPGNEGAPDARAAAEGADAIVKRYVRVMLGNCLAGAKRRCEKPSRSDDDSGHRLPTDGPAQAPTDVRRVFELVMNAAVRGLDDTARRGLERDAGEILELAEGRLTMAALVAAETSRGPSEPRKRVADRLYKRHQRAREALLLAVDVLEKGRRISGLEADDARAFVQGLLNRSQKRSRRPSSG